MKSAVFRSALKYTLFFFRPSFYIRPQEWIRDLVIPSKFPYRLIFVSSVGIGSLYFLESIAFLLALNIPSLSLDRLLEKGWSFLPVFWCASYSSLLLAPIFHFFVARSGSTVNILQSSLALVLNTASLLPVAFLITVFIFDEKFLSGYGSTNTQAIRFLLYLFGILVFSINSLRMLFLSFRTLCENKQTDIPLTSKQMETPHPPWIQYPGFPPADGFWRQSGEAWFANIWTPFWDSLSESKQKQYLSNNPPPGDWQSYYFDNDFQNTLSTIDYVSQLDLAIQVLNGIRKSSYGEKADIVERFMDKIGALFLEHLQFHLKEVENNLNISSREIIQHNSSFISDIYLSLLGSGVLEGTVEDDTWYWACKCRTNIEAFNLIFENMIDPEGLEGIDSFMQEQKRKSLIGRTDLPQNIPRSHWWWFE